MKEIKALAMPIVARSSVDTDKLVIESVEVKRSIDDYLENGYKIESTHPMTLGEVGYLVYSLVKEA